MGQEQLIVFEGPPIFSHDIGFQLGLNVSTAPDIVLRPE